MSNPVLVEVLRGGLVESRHCGAVAVVDAAGASVLAIGDVAVPVFPRSAIKALQALPLVESGAADRYGFGDEELALACASHSGEPAHVAGVERMLVKAGLETSALACGTHWPINQPAAYALAKTGAPSALHNNCSGKHAGFLCLACATGIDHSGYWRPEHPVQRQVRGVLEDLTGAVLGPDRCAIDGCSVPTWAIPLANLAHAFAKFGSGHGLSRERAGAAARLRAACAQKPWYVAGTGRFCTEIMQLLGARAFVKTGAEGVFCGALPELGFGIAVKCDDGAGRAAETIMAAVIARLLPLEPTERAAFTRFVHPVLRNWNGIEVGALRVTHALS
ncbi:MAG TPA: asparaginase [Xanthobacteraceae bacterium]|nr:asparaginase [Xanthobacteraceae bacterium]